MGRSAAFRMFARLMSIAHLAEHQGCSATDAREALRAKTSAHTSPTISRRQFLLAAAATGATPACPAPPPCAPIPLRRTFAGA
ncbi:MAG: hypothetical protein HC938_11135 [Nitrospira sp.]|nr:hypothetical protein [Nitrospira sp.]